MKYNFDEVINRINSNSVKYETSKEEEPNLREDFIPMWIADMDFACLPEVIEAMHKRLDMKILGYSDIVDVEYLNVLKKWMKNQFGWDFNQEYLRISSGVVPAISNLIQILTKVGDKIMIMTPSYAPFHEVVVNNDRLPVYLSFKNNNQYFKIDFERMEQVIVQESIKVLIFCNPHNPTGRVWKENELKQVVEICERNQVSIINDEIHQDIIRQGQVHIPLSKLYPDINWIYTCTAPSKTFNMAGNHMSNIFIPNKEVREIWDNKYYYLPNPLSIVATKAAYEYGEEWVKELKEYIDGNFKYMKQFLNDKLPKVIFEIPEGTYLAWINMKNIGLTECEIKKKFIEEAGLHIEMGDMFVADAEYCIRVNLACPRQILKNALNRMYEVFGTI